MRRKLIATMAAVAASLVFAAPASAYVRTRTKDGQYPLIWPSPQITLTVCTGGPEVVPADDFVAAVTRAAATWNDPALDSSVELDVVSSPDMIDGPRLDYLNTVSFRTSNWDAPDYDPHQLALTFVWLDGGRIVDTDTEINAATAGINWGILSDDPAIAGASTDVADVQNAVTHEIGHVLGLDHPCYLGGQARPGEVTNEGGPVPSCADQALPATVLAATMFPSAARGSISERTLSPDEILALHDLYPVGRTPVVEGPPEQGGGGGCAIGGGRAAPSGAALVAAAALLLARRGLRA
jgi:hypothetical protein